MYREIKELLKLAAVHAPLYGFLKLFCTFLSALFVPANALLLQRILDGLVSFSCSGRLPADWYRDLVWMAGLLLGEGLLTGTDGLLAVRFEMQVTDRLETRLMEKLRNLEYSRMEEPQIQDLLSGISQNPSREICSAFWKLSEGLRTAGTLAGMLAIYLWKASGLVPVFVLCMTQMLRKNGRAGELWFALYEKQTRSQRRGRYYGRLLTGKNSLTELKIFQAVLYVQKLWELKNREIQQEQKGTLHQMLAALLGKSFWSVLWLFSSVAVLAAGFYRGTLSAGTFAMLLQSVLQMAQTVTGLFEVFGNLPEELKKTGLLRKFLMLEEEEKAKDHLSGPAGRIQFDRVSFSYPQSRQPILKDLSFTLDLRERMVLVGENGSGKTTLTALMLGLYRPTEGRILLDGRDIGTYGPEELGKVMRAVFQDFVPYQLTVRENLAFGDMKSLRQDQRLRQALRCVGLEAELGETLDAPLGKTEKEGRDLSGGQWQRLAAGRFFLADNVYMILDEPTAALDPLGEEHLHQMLCRAEETRRRGFLLIAHRLSHALTADRILVLADGKIAEQGSHQELMEAGGMYCSMFRQQAQWYGE